MNKKLIAQAEELADFLSFFCEKFDLPAISVRRIPQKGNRYNFPRLPNFSKLNELFTQKGGLDFCYKTYKANKDIIKAVQEEKPDKDIKRLLSYLRYMAKQEFPEYIYLTRLENTKNNHLNELKKFINTIEILGFELKNLLYSSKIGKKFSKILKKSSTMSEELYKILGKDDHDIERRIRYCRQ